MALTIILSDADLETIAAAQKDLQDIIDQFAELVPGISELIIFI